MKKKTGFSNKIAIIFFISHCFVANGHESWCCEIIRQTFICLISRLVSFNKNMHPRKSIASRLTKIREN